MNYQYNNKPPTRHPTPNPTQGGGYPAYRPPVYEQPPERPPHNQRPSGFYGRGQQAAKGVAGLSHRAGYDSTAWWLFKVVQGCMISSFVLLIMVFFLFLAMLPGGSGLLIPVCVFLIGLAFVIVLWHLAAPVTGRWIVTVPEQWYYVVEDRYGFTVDYLEPGRIAVPWRFNAKVYKYANFNSVIVNHTIPDVLGTASLPVTLKARVTLAFNPMRAESDYFVWLRQMNTPDKLEHVMAGEVERIVLLYLDALDPDRGHVSLTNAPSLEAVIVDQLSGQASRGLVPVAENPVKVTVEVSDQIREAYRTTRARVARRNEEEQMLLDINTLAQELQVPYPDAFRLFYLLKRGAPLDLGDTPLPNQPRPTIFDRFRRPATPPPAPAPDPPRSPTPPPATYTNDTRRKTDEHRSVNRNGDQPDPPTDFDDYFNPMEDRGSS